MTIRCSLFSGVLLAALLGLGCSAEEKLVAHSSGRPSAGAGIDYSIVYLLHADADYLYHDEGIPLQADQEVLKKAQATGKSAGRGEVFIFHQRPERKILWLFPKKDRVMYHYRNGQLVNRVRYSPRKNSAFVSESGLYAIHSSADDSGQPLKRVLLFYGHEIPQRDRKGYHQSRPDAPFGSSAFAEGIASFHAADSNDSPGSGRAAGKIQPSGSNNAPDSHSLFDLIVLSTCNNGTPHMMNLLKDKAHYVLASPQNLHLSHIDSDSLAALERNPGISAADLAGKMADQTLDRMSESIQTGVTLALYDMAEVREYVAALAGRVMEQRAREKQKAAGAENTDCMDLLSRGPTSGPGVSVWHNPPSFGPGAGREHHSGWGCVGVKN